MVWLSVFGGGVLRAQTMIGRYKKLFRSSPETAILAVYGFVHLVVLLTSAEVEQVKSLLHALGMR